MNGEQPDNDSAEKDLETLLEILRAGMDALKRSDKKDVLTQVEQRKELAESLSLGGRLLRIYDEVKFVPDDRKDLLRRYRCVVSGREVQGTDLTTIIRFNLRSKGYVLRFREPPVSYEEVNAYLDLCKATGEVLFSVRLKFEVDDTTQQWLPVDVDAFIPGDWIKDFLVFSMQLAAETEQPKTQPDTEETEELKRRFGLQ